MYRLIYQELSGIEWIYRLNDIAAETDRAALSKARAELKGKRTKNETLWRI